MENTAAKILFIIDNERVDLCQDTDDINHALGFLKDQRLLITTESHTKLPRTLRSSVEDKDNNCTQIIRYQIHTYDNNGIPGPKSSSEEPWKLPEKNECFIERYIGEKNIVTQLREQFNEYHSTLTVQSIIGLNGVGKTQLALAYAHHHHEDYDLIAWFQMGPNIWLDYLDFVENKLKVKLEKGTPRETVILSAYKALEKYPKVLMIFANAKDDLSVQQFLQPKTHNNALHILITACRPLLNMPSIEISHFQPSEATQYIKKHLTSKVCNDLQAESLAKELPYYPLALSIAVAYLNQNKNDDMIAYLKQLSPLKTISSQESNPIELLHHQILSLICQISVKKISENFVCQEAKEKAFDLLKIWSCLETYKISKVAFSSSPSELLLLDRSTKLLTSYSLIQTGRIAFYYNMHRALQRVIYEEVPDKSILLKRACLLISKFIPSKNNIPGANSDDEIKLLLPHAVRVIELATGINDCKEAVEELSKKVSYWYEVFGDDEQCKMLLDKMKIKSYNTQDQTRKDDTDEELQAAIKLSLSQNDTTSLSSSSASFFAHQQTGGEFHNNRTQNTPKL